MVDTYTCNKHIPFKFSFFVWRALRKKVPTNEMFSTFNIPPAICGCCYNLGSDTIHHTFVAGHFTKRIWQIFSSSLGIVYVATVLRIYC